MTTLRPVRVGSAPRAALVVAAFALASSACGGGSSGPLGPTGLSLVTAPSTGAASGVVLSVAPSIQLVDRSGMPVGQAGVPISVALDELGGTLSGTTVQPTDATGRAAFPGLRVVAPVGTYGLLFSAPGLSGARATLELAAGAAALLRPVSVQQQYAPEWSQVRVPPRVRVTDETGNPVAGVRIVFLPGAGSGLVTADAVTGAGGEATAGTWVLGAQGEYGLEARAEGLESPVAFSATALPAQGMFRIAQQPPSSVSVWEILRPSPQVQLFDAYGMPSTVQGVAVTVSVGGGPGSVAGMVVRPTDAAGKATFAGISFSGDAAGTRTLLFTSDQRAAAESAPVSVGPGATSAYAVTLRYLTGASPGQVAAFEWARARVAGMITGDLADVFVDYPAMPECGNIPIAEIVDDLLIWVELRPIDGVGGILGQAGPCLIRSSSKLPIVGIMMFDTADLQELEDKGQLDSVILHEMLHVVGFGVAWRDLGLISGAGTADPFFTGVAARDAFIGFDGGASYPGMAVPLENTGGTGTRESHWRESVLRDELMTGWLSGATSPLSRTTIASLGDLGYTVDLSRAEPLGSAQALRADSLSSALDLGEDVLPIPVREVPEL